MNVQTDTTHQPRGLQEPHCVHVLILTPGNDVNDAGQIIYNRLQEAGFGENSNAFCVTAAASAGGCTTPLINLYSGEREAVDLMLGSA